MPVAQGINNARGKATTTANNNNNNAKQSKSLTESIEASCRLDLALSYDDDNLVQGSFNRN